MKEITIIRKWKARDGFMYGQTENGTIFIFHEKCQQTMIQTGIKVLKRTHTIQRLYECKACGAKKTY